MNEMTITYVLAGVILCCTFLNLINWFNIANKVARMARIREFELDWLRTFNPDIAATHLEAHFRKKRNQEGIMLIQTCKQILHNKPTKKPQ